MEWIFVCGGGAEHREVNQRGNVVFGKGSLGFSRSQRIEIR